MKDFHKIQIKQREDCSDIMNGRNTQIFLDGQPLKGVTKAKFEVSGNTMGKLTLEILGSFEIEGTFVKGKNLKKTKAGEQQ
jgi:hypothetical protein